MILFKQQGGAVIMDQATLAADYIYILFIFSQK